MSSAGSPINIHRLSSGLSLRLASPSIGGILVNSGSWSRKERRGLLVLQVSTYLYCDNRSLEAFIRFEMMSYNHMTGIPYPGARLQFQRLQVRRRRCGIIQNSKQTAASHGPSLVRRGLRTSGMLRAITLRSTRLISGYRTRINTAVSVLPATYHLGNPHCWFLTTSLPTSSLSYSTTAQTMSGFYSLKAERPGGNVYDFAALKGKTVLIVNVASKWCVLSCFIDCRQSTHPFWSSSGFTPQYKGIYNHILTEIPPS